MPASCVEKVTAVWEWRQNPKEQVDQFIGSILVNAGQLFRGHAELPGVRVHAFPHGSEDHLKVYLEPVQKRQTSPVVCWVAQVVVGSRPAARVGRVQQVLLVERVRQSDVCVLVQDLVQV